MDNEQKKEYIKFGDISLQKTYILIAVSIIILIAFIIVLVVPSGKKINIEFDWTEGHQQIMQDNKDNSTLKSTNNLISFTTTDIEFFKHEHVDVKYYFSGRNNILSRIVYDVSKCGELNVTKMIKSLDKSYKCIKNVENKINGSTKQQIMWTGDDTNIYFEKITTAGAESADGSVTMKFSFKPNKNK